MATDKTNYMQMFYDSIVYKNPDYCIVDQVNWTTFTALRNLAEHEFLPLIRQHPWVFKAMSADMQELIMECFMPEFISAVLNINGTVKQLWPELPPLAFIALPDFRNIGELNSNVTGIPKHYLGYKE